MTNQPKLKWSAFEKYLAPFELQGRRARLTIDHVAIEETHPRQGVTETCPVLYFRETKRGLVLSRTNRRALAKAFGDDAEACIGKQVLVEAVAVQVANREMTPIRITAPAPIKAAPSREDGIDKTTGEILDEPAEAKQDHAPTEPTGTSAPAPETTPGMQAVAVQETQEQPAGNAPTGTPARPASANVKRPMSAEQVRDAIRAKAGTAPGTPTTQYLAGTMASLSGLVHGNDADRRGILKFLFGVESGKELTMAQCRALRGWIAAEKTEDDEWIPSAFSVEEAKLILRAHAIEQGQVEMPLEPAAINAADVLEFFGQPAKPVGK